MDKIYNYKRKDVLTLMEEINTRNGKPLAAVFREAGKKTGKTAGTIRNMYYDLAKNGQSSKEFCENFASGGKLAVRKKQTFSESEERQLLKEIIIGQCHNVSVRSTTLKKANGDAELALRFQNKYRSVARKNSKLIAEITEEIKSELNLSPPDKEKRPLASELQYRRLISEIDGLIGRISLSVKTENEALKTRIKELESEIYNNKAIKKDSNDEKAN